MQTKAYNKQIQCERQDAVPRFSKKYLVIWWVLCYSPCRLRPTTSVRGKQCVYPLLWMTIYLLLRPSIFRSNVPISNGIWLAFRFQKTSSGNFICHQTSRSCRIQHGGTTHLASFVLCNQDVPGRQISVHKGFACQILHTWGYILAENEECMGSVRWYQLSWSDVKWKSL